MATAESYILFELAGTTYAVPSRLVQRMEMIESVTPVPSAPPFVEGVVFSQGRVVPAINLRRRFGFETIAHDMSTRLIVIAHADRVVGLIVDSAREFVNIPASMIQPPPASMTGTSGSYLEGIASLNGKAILILAVGEVLTAGESPSAPESLEP